MKKTKKNIGIQLSLFDDMREVTDNELISELTNKPAVSEEWTGEYRLERLFNSLTPHRRRIAMAAVELYKRRNAARDNRKAIRNSQDVFDIMQPLVGDLDNEEFWLMPLNQAGRVIDTIRTTMGGISCTPVDVRLIMRKLVEVAATAFIVVHNHPSGNVQPSTEDRKITEAIRRAAEIFSIRLHDHIIIGHNRYYSFSDDGVL